MQKLLKDTTKFSLGDVRITTRVDEKYLGEALFRTIHEGNQAIYAQVIPLDLDETPLAAPPETC